MSRIAVVAYLMVATVVGPWACCCSPARLAFLDPTPRALATAAPSCCHSAQQPSNQAPTESPEKRQPVRPGCPCQGESLSSISLTVSTEVSRLIGPELTVWIADLASGPAVSNILLTLPGLALSGAGAHLPFLTTDDLLNVLHMLRC